MEQHESLPDDAIVVRGGRPTGKKLLNGCAQHAGVYGFSVQSAPERTSMELVDAGRIPHSSVAITTVGAIRATGYDVIPTPGMGYHATVVVPQDLPEPEADKLATVFRQEENPSRKRSP